MNNRYLLNALKICFPVVALSLTGCNNWLDVKPENEQAINNFWNTKEEVGAVMMGAYQGMRTSLEKLVIWGELRSDEIEIGPGWSDNENALSIKRLEIKDDNAMVKWVDLYSVIGRCNALIKYADLALVNDLSFTREACDEYVAEAKWLRALTYFYLVRSFRDVPYITEPYLDDNQSFRMPKTDGMAILSTLIADLDDASKALPVAYAPGSWENKGRATVWAAFALMADIHLWLEQYQEAIDMCEKIENSQLYELLPTNNWYGLYYPGNSVESIFELQWEATLSQTNQLFAWTYNESESNNYAASESLMTKFQSGIGVDSDIRGSGGSYLEANGKIWKYAGTSRGSGNLRESGYRDANWIVYRYADVLLMKAEALFLRGGAGDFDAAYDIILTIRDRANAYDLLDPPVNESEALDLILDERMRELCFEGKRWFDLVRIAIRDDGRYKDKLIALLVANVAAMDRPLYEVKLQNTYGYFFPINDTDIDTGGGLLVQNPYYI